MPHRAMASSRSPSARTRTIGAAWSGKMPQNSGRLPVRCGSHGTNRGSRTGLCQAVEVAHSLVLLDQPQLRKAGRGVRRPWLFKVWLVAATGTPPIRSTVQL
jgi:hypothetical protein